MCCCLNACSRNMSHDECFSRFVSNSSVRVPLCVCTYWCLLLCRLRVCFPQAGVRGQKGEKGEPAVMEPVSYWLSVSSFTWAGVFKVTFSVVPQPFSLLSSVHTCWLFALYRICGLLLEGCSSNGSDAAQPDRWKDKCFHWHRNCGIIMSATFSYPYISSQNAEKSLQTNTSVKVSWRRFLWI